MGSYNYNRENTRRVVLALNKRTDADIITALEAQDNMQSYLKSLIRADIEKSADHADEENTMKKFNIKLGFSGCEDVNYIFTEGTSGGAGAITATAYIPFDECPEDESEAYAFCEYYGYLTMKRAIIEALNSAGYSADGVTWFYDDDDGLPENAAADCRVELDIDYDALDELSEENA